MPFLITTTVIQELLAIGRSEHLEDPHVFDPLARRHDLGTLNRSNSWEEWGTATSALSEDDLVALVKALTMMDNIRDVSGGSVAGAVWVYRVLEKRNPGNWDSLCDWISARTDHHWITGYYRGHLRPHKLSPQEQQQLEQRRKQADSERVRVLGELEPLSPRERLVCMAEQASLPPPFFPAQWADVTDEELLAFDAAGWSALTQWIAPMRKGSWKRLHDQMKLIEDRHPWHLRL